MARARRLSSVISEIRYYTNYSDPSAPVISLGAIAEAVTDETMVLAMLGRATLTADELKHVAGYNRAELEDVWGLLTKAFSAAWEQRPSFKGGLRVGAGAMLKFLADKYSMSLHFESPQPLNMTQRMAERVERAPKALGVSVLSLLEARLTPALPKQTTARARRSPRARPVASSARRRFREASTSEAVAVL